MNITFNGLGMNLGNLSQLSNAQTRSISAENFTGEKGKGGMAVEGTGAACARNLRIEVHALGWRSGGRYLNKGGVTKNKYNRSWRQFPSCLSNFSFR